MFVPGETPLTIYGLAGSFVGERLREGEGWDICSIIHRPTGIEGELSVTVIRRTTARHERGAPRVAIPAELARESVAMRLVVDNPCAGNDVFAAAKEIANDDRAWRERYITVDGVVVDGHEREFGGRWVAYYLTPLLIVSVLAPVALRLDEVELRRLCPDEIARMETVCLSDIEEDLLELCAEAPHMAETTTTLHVKLVSDTYDRPAVEAALRGLVAQGLMTRYRGILAGTRRSPEGQVTGDRDDWWVVTDKGRAAIGLPGTAARNDD
jgi:hypothetical protein